MKYFASFNSNTLQLMKILISIIFCFFLTSNTSIYAQEEKKTKNRILTSKFKVEAGVFFHANSLKVRGNLDVPDFGIELDESVEIKDYKSTFFANFDWRFSSKWTLSAEYLSTSKSNEATLKDDFPIGEYVFEKGTGIKVGTSMKLYRVYVGRVITKGLKHEFGAGLGVHAMTFNLSLEGIAIINGEGNVFANAKSDTTIPLPNVVIWYVFAPNEKWSFEARTDWFGVKIEDISGVLWDLEPKVNYEITKNFGVGASYRFFQVDVELDTGEWGGNLEMKYNGPTISLHGRF